jgi:hypothetical protein
MFKIKTVLVLAIRYKNLGSCHLHPYTTKNEKLNCISEFLALEVSASQQPRNWDNRRTQKIAIEICLPGEEHTGTSNYLNTHIVILRMFDTEFAQN